MIQIKFISRQDESKPGLYAPVFCCDWCKQQIDNGDMALYKWQDTDNRLPVPGSVVILHKGDCDEAHNQKHQASSWPWDELTTLLAHLVNNTQPTRSESWNIWPYLVNHYCPDEQLAAVAKVAQRGIDYPNDRPPLLEDFTL
jgi:hypothetical protein